MPGSIMPLPVMLEEEDRKRYEQLQPPATIVCRYGHQKRIAELPYDGQAKPGCGTKLVIRTDRGIELAEMLTTTCANAGCGKSITRKQMLRYIENSGGRAYPFTNKGRVMRVATVEDLNEQARLDARKSEMLQYTRALVGELDLRIRLVEVEILLGGELVIFHYTCEKWVDFRTFVRQLDAQFQTRIEMNQVNAREEARLVADYERCGQYCCCKNFLKVLKPVSMRSAKVQKATLDPSKISGRCGRLMCCLRYEDQTYEQLRKKLPPRQARIQTDDGPGVVMATQILTQLVLVKLDGNEETAAYPIEHIRVVPKGEPLDEGSRSRADHPPPAKTEGPARPPAERPGSGGGETGRPASGQDRPDEAQARQNRGGRPRRRKRRGPRRREDNG